MIACLWVALQCPAQSFLLQGLHRVSLQCSRAMGAGLSGPKGAGLSGSGNRAVALFWFRTGREVCELMVPCRCPNLSVRLCFLAFCLASENVLDSECSRGLILWNAINYR